MHADVGPGHYISLAMLLLSCSRKTCFYSTVISTIIVVNINVTMLASRQKAKYADCHASGHCA